MFLGFTPFSQAAVPIHLGSGGTSYLPPGNGIVTLGRVSILQWFDYGCGIWRNFGAPATSNINIVASDGANYRIINNSGTATGALITNAGSGATNGIGATATGVSVSFGSAPASGRAATAHAIVGGSINTTITITTAGAGLTALPLLYFDPPPAGGIAAAAKVDSLSSGGIGAVTVTNAGAGYTAVPNCYVVPQWVQYPAASIAGQTTQTLYAARGLNSPQNPITPQMVPAVVGPWTTAPVLTVNATLGGSGTLTGIVMDDYGANYVGTAIPTITVTGAGAAAATAIMSFSATSITVSNAGVAGSVAPAFQTSSGLVSAHDGANGYYNIKPARGISALSSTTTTILTSITVEDPGYGMQKVPVVGFEQAGGTAWTTWPAGTAVVGGIADTSIWQPSHP